MGRRKNLKPNGVAAPAMTHVPAKSKKIAKKLSVSKFKTKNIPKSKELDNPSDKLRKIVSNLKRRKEQVSSNWKAFLASDFAPKPMSSESRAQNPAAPINSAYVHQKSGKRRPVPQMDARQDLSAEEKPTNALNSDDPYVYEVEPKSEADKKELTRCIAMDCEMVGVHDGKESVLARVSLVNQYCECIYDTFVKAKEKVADYRTAVSGVRPADLKRGEEFEVVQKKVAAILKGRILVGHALRNDMKVLFLSHPPKMIRDTSRFKPFRQLTNGNTPSLKKLSAEILGVTIQSGEHSSVEDAKAAMQLYNLYQKEWENHRLQNTSRKRNNAEPAASGLPKIGGVKEKKGRSGIYEKSKNLLIDEFAAF